MALAKDTKQSIVCNLCKQPIEPLSREIPSDEREYKADIVISRDAYWNDAGIFTIVHTRLFFHKGCFENAKEYYKQQMGKKDNRES